MTHRSVIIVGKNRCNTEVCIWTIVTVWNLCAIWTRWYSRWLQHHWNARLGRTAVIKLTRHNIFSHCKDAAEILLLKVCEIETGIKTKDIFVYTVSNHSPVQQTMKNIMETTWRSLEKAFSLRKVSCKFLSMQNWGAKCTVWRLHHHRN